MKLGIHHATSVVVSTALVLAGCGPTLSSKPQWVDAKTSMTQSDSIQSTIAKLGEPIDAQSSGNNLALIYCQSPSFGKYEHFVVWFEGRRLKSASTFQRSPSCGTLEVDWDKSRQSNKLEGFYRRSSGSTFSNAMSEGLDRQLEILQDSRRRNKDDTSEQKKTYKCTPDLLGNFDCR